MSAAAPTPTAPPFHRLVALPSGHSLHYHEVVDASAAPSGTTVVLIQGSGPGANGWSNFKHNVGPLAAAGHRVLVPDLTPRLPQLKLPILGFWGQEDLFCPVSGAHKVLAACPQTAFYLYGGVGHWVMIERAAEFNRHLLHFLAD